MPSLFETGMFVRTPAWHQGGNVLSEYPENWDEARKYAGLEWEPIKRPTYEFRGVDAGNNPVGEPGDGVTGDYFIDPDRTRIVRSDTGDTLAVANKTYEIITHADMGLVMQAILDEPNVKYETAGVLDSGRCVWALAYLDEPITLPGDFSPTLPYLALTNHHDGGGSLAATSTNVRIVCANTQRASEAQGKALGTHYSFRHTKNWRDKIEDARNVIKGVRQEFREYCEIATELLGVTITPQQREMFVTEFIGEPPVGMRTERVMNNIERSRDSLRLILQSPTTEPVAHTAYGLVQGAVEYLDHVRKARSWETKLGRSIMRPEPLKARAVKIVRDLIPA